MFESPGSFKTFYERLCDIEAKDNDEMHEHWLSFRDSESSYKYGRALIFPKLEIKILKEEPFFSCSVICPFCKEHLTFTEEKMMERLKQEYELNNTTLHEIESHE